MSKAMNNEKAILLGGQNKMHYGTCVDYGTKESILGNYNDIHHEDCLNCGSKRGVCYVVGNECTAKLLGRHCGEFI